jgi:hypothetical protein
LDPIIVARESQKFPVNRNRAHSPADSRRVERSILGAILLDNSLYDQAAEHLTPNDFSLDAHRRVYSRIRDLQGSGRPVDMITLVEELDRHKELEAIGGVAYLSSLIDGLPERLSIAHYVQMVRQAAGARAIAHGTDEISELARKGTSIPELRSHLAELDAVAAQYQDNGSETIHRVEDLPDIYALNAPPINWIVPGIIPQGKLILLTGPPGIGKSFLAEALAVAVASGAKFLGRDCKQTPVLYEDKENDLSIVKHRLDILAGASVSGLYVWGGWNEEDPARFDDHRLLKFATEASPLIIFDTLVRFHSADENAASEMSQVMEPLQRLADAGATVLVLHHRGKNENSKFRGSEDIEAAPAMAYALKRSEDGLVLDRFKTRIGVEKQFPLRVDFANGTFDLLDLTVEDRIDEVAIIRDIIAANPGLTKTAICKAAKPTISRDRTLTVLNRHVGRHWAMQTGSRNNASLYYPLEVRFTAVSGFPPLIEGEETRKPDFPGLRGGYPETGEPEDNKEVEPSGGKSDFGLRTPQETGKPSVNRMFAKSAPPLPETASETPVRPAATNKPKEPLSL